MTATAPRKPWILRRVCGDQDPDAAPRVQRTMYLDRILIDAYDWLWPYPGRSCAITFQPNGPDDAATLALDEHGRVVVDGAGDVADAVRRELARGLPAAWMSGYIPDHRSVWQLRVDGLPDDLGRRELYRPTHTIWGALPVQRTVRLAQQLAGDWHRATPAASVAVTHLTEPGELRVRYDHLDPDTRQHKFTYAGHGSIPQLLGFRPATPPPVEAG